MPHTGRISVSLPARWRAAAKAVSVAVLVAACDEPAEGPFFEIQGGGFIYNYRVADRYYGFVARPLRKLPEDGVVEAQFDNPDGPEPVIVRQPVRPGRLKYSFRTPPLSQIVPGHRYRVDLVLRDARGSEVWRTSTSYVTELDPRVVSDRPATIGPGYHRNPRAAAPQ